jgi:Phage integrase family
VLVRQRVAKSVSCTVGPMVSVVALEQWRVASGITEGAVSRPIDCHRIGSKRLSGEGVCLVVRRRVEAAAIDPENYSGHSLRAGLATSAAQAGVPSWKIRRQTGHASDAMLARYIPDAELFTDNAARGCFEAMMFRSKCRVDLLSAGVSGCGKPVGRQEEGGRRSCWMRGAL